MAICLGINDDIQQTFARYDSFKKQTKPKLFTSSFLGEYAGCNMIKNLENYGENVVVGNNVVSGSNKQQQVDLLGLSSSNEQVSNNNNDNNNKNYVKDLNDLFS